MHGQISHEGQCQSLFINRDCKSICCVAQTTSSIGLFFLSGYVGSSSLYAVTAGFACAADASLACTTGCNPDNKYSPVCSGIAEDAGQIVDECCYSSSYGGSPVVTINDINLDTITKEVIIRR